VQFAGSTQRNLSMLVLSNRMTDVLASMHWTLIKFDQPVLALSDHPVVVWPINRASRAATAEIVWGPVTALECECRCHLGWPS
jgi:hypothetical protein